MSGHLNPQKNEDVISMMRRFSTAAKYLSERPRADKRTQSYCIKDEYDVQDLLYAILKTVIPDLEREDPVSKIAGDSGRVDLCSSLRGMVVEIKYVSSAKRAAALVSECGERVLRYYKWPSLRHLVFFIYDPDSHLKDPDNFIRDLTSPVTQFNGKEFSVTTVISPYQAGAIQQADLLVAPLSLRPEELALLYGQNNSLAFAVGQPFYTRERRAIIVPIRISNPFNQPNTIAEVSMTIGKKTYGPCSPPPDLIIGGGWLPSSSIRIEQWGCISGAWFFGAGIMGEAIELESKTNAKFRVIPVRGNALEETLLVVPLAELRENTDGNSPTT